MFKPGVLETLKKAAPLLVLCFGLVYGLVYVFLLPPWQHHDEPSHYEYVWMLAREGAIPERNAYDNSVRLRLVESMKRHNFFTGPALTGLGETAATMDPVWIGVTQVGDPPLYYGLAALLLKRVEGLPLEQQLYALRGLSLLLLLGVLAAAWLMARELTPAGHPLQWIVPLSLALMPAFMEHNTALNNDVAAALVYSLILLFGTRLIRRGWNVLDVAALLALMGLSFITKASIWLSVLVVPLAFYFTALRRRSAWLALGGLALAALLGVLVLFDFDDAALWLRQSHQPEPTRVNTAMGWAYQLRDESPATTSALYQIIPDQPALHGGEVTVGAWMWGQPGQVAYPPGLMVMNLNYQVVTLQPQPVVLQATPTFYAASFELPEQYFNLYAVLDPLPNPGDTGAVYYWRPVMTLGVYRASDPLQLAEDGSHGTWRGERFDNLVRNSALGQSWPKFKPQLFTLFESIDYRISEAANWVVYSLDVEGAGWYTRASVESLFNSFWARFGWGQVNLRPWAYRLLLAFSIIGLAAGLAAFTRLVLIGRRVQAGAGAPPGAAAAAQPRRFASETSPTRPRPHPRRDPSEYAAPHIPPRILIYLLAWLLFAIVCVLFFAWFTGISGKAYLSKPIYPDARYINPVAIPILLAISGGWYALTGLLPARRRWAGLAVYFLFFALLNLLSLATIFRYFYP